MADIGEMNPRPRKRRGGRKVLRWVVGILLGLMVILYIASFFLDEPVRRAMESNMNRHLKGYSVQLPGLHVQLIGLSVTLRGLTIRQQAHPNPPLIYFPYLKASIHWREILSGHVVAEFSLVDPKMHINLPQLKAEAENKTPVKQRGWQQALEDIYPLKINALTISNGSITYIDQDPKRPLVLSHLNFDATNIRNIHLPDKVYPSTFHLNTDIFGTGHGSVNGRANFLAEPTPGIMANFKLDKVPIDYFKPVVARANLTIHGGVLKGSGNFEFAPKIEKARVETMTIQGLQVEYIHSPATAAAEKRHAAVAKKAAKKVTNKPGIVFRIDKLNLTQCTFGMRNEDKAHPYRLFISDADLHLANLSNQFAQGEAEARLTGKFMGSGVTDAVAHFRPESSGPDFDLRLKITDTQLTSLNDLLRSYGNFDVAAGKFSLVTELRVKNNVINGYIKPFFRDMKVYDKRKDKDKGLFHKMYEMLIGGVAKLLENRPRKAVATKATISGPLESPKMNTLQIILELIRNGFIKAILPTFERQVTGSRGG